MPTYHEWMKDEVQLSSPSSAPTRNSPLPKDSTSQSKLPTPMTNSPAGDPNPNRLGAPLPPGRIRHASQLAPRRRQANLHHKRPVALFHSLSHLCPLSRPCPRPPQRRKPLPDPQRHPSRLHRRARAHDRRAHPAPPRLWTCRPARLLAVH